MGHTEQWAKRIVEILVYSALFLGGSTLIVVGLYLHSTLRDVFLSIGTSITAASIVYIILSVVLGDPFSPMMERLKQSVEILETSGETGLLGIWKHRSDVPVQDFIQHLRNADQHIDILGYAIAFLPEHPDFSPLLEKKAASGCKIRILLGDPSGSFIQNRTQEEQHEGSIASRIETTIMRFRPLIDKNMIELRLHDTPLYNSIYRFDDHMYVTPQLYGLRGSAAPLLLLQKSEHGLFSSYLQHFEAVWNSTESINEGTVLPQPPLQSATRAR